MLNLNLTILIGRVVSPPVTTRKGVTSFILETTEVIGSKGQVRVEQHHITVFGHLAGTCEQIGEGWIVHVRGKNATHTWQDDQGALHSRKEVIGEQVEFLVRNRGAA